MLEIQNKKTGEIFTFPTPNGKPCKIDKFIPLSDKEITEYFKRKLEIKSEIAKRKII